MVACRVNKQSTALLIAASSNGSTAIRRPHRRADVWGAHKPNKRMIRSCRSLKHGRYTAEAIARRREVSALVRAMKVLARNH